ncbi:MAG: transketolase [Propioniciclava sp.]
MSREALLTRGTDADTLRTTATELRRSLMRLSHSYPGPIHLGGDLSAADIFTVLFHYGMAIDPANLTHPLRDRFVLSKGHAAVCMYLTMAQRGFFSYADIEATYGQLDSAYGMHPCKVQLPGVEVSTGSLGHGFPLATGLALRARQQGAPHRVFTLLGDGESGEGSIWEAALIASSYRLGNLVAFVDRNHMLMTTRSEELIMLEPYADKWAAFGWNVVQVDGHDMAALMDVIDTLPDPDAERPTVVIADTLKGKGVDFMEGQLGWHAGSLTDADLDRALTSLNATATEKEPQR